MYLCGDFGDFMPSSFGSFLTRRTKESLADEQQADDAGTNGAFLR